MARRRIRRRLTVCNMLLHCERAHNRCMNKRYICKKCKNVEKHQRVRGVNYHEQFKKLDKI